MPSPLFQPFPMVVGRRTQMWPYDPQYRMPRHFHDEPEINLVVRGSGTLGVGEWRVPVSPGTALLFQSGQDHVLLDASRDLELFVIAIHPQLAERAFGAQAPISGRTWQLPPCELADVAERVRGLREVSNAEAHESQLTDLFKLAATRVAGGHVLSRRALECVRAKPGLSGAAVARHLRTSQSDISRHFHRDLGITFVEYRARLRLMQFIALVDKGATMTRAALEADFGSYAQCHRVFRRMLQCAPQEYFEGGRHRLDDARFCLA